MYEYRDLRSVRSQKRTQEILEEIQDDGGQPGSATVYANDLAILLSYFEQRIEELERKMELSIK